MRERELVARTWRAAYRRIGSGLDASPGFRVAWTTHADHRREPPRNTPSSSRSRCPPTSTRKDLDRAYRAIAQPGQDPRLPQGQGAEADHRRADRPRRRARGVRATSSCPTTSARPSRDEDLAPITDPDIDVEQLEPTGKPLHLHGHGRGAAAAGARRGATTPGVKVEKPTTEVDRRGDRDVDRTAAASGSPSSSPSSGPRSETDFVTIDLSATRSGASIEELTRDGLPLFGRVRGVRRDARRRAPRRQARRHHRSSTRNCPRSDSARSSPGRPRSGCW